MSEKKVSVNDLDRHEEILAAIREKAKEITGGDLSVPVYLDGVSVKEEADLSASVVKRLMISSIFYNNHRLCGDLCSSDSPEKGFIFGRDLSDLEAKELIKIFRALCNGNCRIDEEDRIPHITKKTLAVVLKKSINRYMMSQKGA